MSRENVAGGLESKDTVEAFTTLNWDWYCYDLPELELSSTLTAIPNLTDTGRVCGEFEIVFRWEFIDDFYWRVSFYESYDSDPHDGIAERNDYGVNASIARDFRNHSIWIRSIRGNVCGAILVYVRGGADSGRIRVT